MSRDARFPTVVGTSLAGTTVRLPDQLAGRLNLLLIAFRRGQRAQMHTWSPFLDALAVRRPDVHVYEVPVLSAAYRPARPSIDGAMRDAVSDPTARERTITLYLDEVAFRAALAVPGDDQIHLRLVDRSGATHGRADGVWDPTKAAALAAVLEEL